VLRSTISRSSSRRRAAYKKTGLRPVCRKWWWSPVGEFIAASEIDASRGDCGCAITTLAISVMTPEEVRDSNGSIPFMSRVAEKFCGENGEPGEYGGDVSVYLDHLTSGFDAYQFDEAREKERSWDRPTAYDAAKAGHADGVAAGRAVGEAIGYHDASNDLLVPKAAYYLQLESIKPTPLA